MNFGDQTSSTSLEEKLKLRNLYRLKDADALATNHVVNTLEDSYRKEVKISQITNSAGLEALIEFYPQDSIPDTTSATKLQGEDRVEW